MSQFEFGPFVLDSSERRLTRDGERLPVTGKTLDVLRLLAEAEGRLVERQTFNAQLWPEVIVEDRNLTVHISALRKALGIDCIETVAKSGYRLATPVRAMNGHAPPGSLDVLREARYQLSQAERVPALRALGLFERALALDGNDAEALAGLASTYLLLSSTTIRRPLPVDEATQLASDAALRALAIDPRKGEAYAVLGRLKMTYDWDWRGAEADLERAVTLAPRSAEAQLGHGLFLSAVGRHREALAALQRARRLEPTRRETHERLGLAWWMAGDGERALAALAEAVAIDPEARRPHFRRMVVLEQLGRHEEAAAARATWLELFGDHAAARRLADLTRVSGHRAAMVEWIARLEKLSQWFEVAIQAMAIGERARALDALDRCLEERADNAPYIAEFPPFRPLAGEPRFGRILDTLRLRPPAAPR
ncbi:Tetratricopeptide repeat-containing protein [Rhodospirillales bacterium URHD0017]|nr:Tetratricopeptide repeat-containing protein [Rhodospirillales bacterium URHD0017]